MKRRTTIFLLAGLVLVVAVIATVYFTAGSHYPSRAADGAAWDESWEMLGPVLGVEAPGNGLTLLDNSAILTADDIFYAAWTAGDSEKFTNEDGEETDVYDAQLYMLAVGCADAENAAKAVREWTDRETDSYAVRETGTEVYNGQTYDLIYYDCVSDANPYQRGVTAFTVYGNYAVSAELTCRESYQGDEADVLADVLSRCHYSADIENG